MYTITDTNAAPYTHSDYAIDPSYCPLVYSYSIGDITSVSVPSAVTRVDKTFSFGYAQDLQPIGETQTVTVTATSGSIYNGTPTEVTDSSTFDLTFENPCIDPAFVTLTATT